MVFARSLIALVALSTGLHGDAADLPIPLGGRLLLEVLADYDQAGYTFIYSTELVRRRTRLAHEPPPGDPISRLRAGLAGEGLRLQPDSRSDVYRIVAGGPGPEAKRHSETTRLSGQITDATTGRPLAGARIEVGDATATTGPDGRFIVETHRPAGLYASHSGYGPKTVDIGGPTASHGPHELVLSLEPIIEEVVVAASRYRIGKHGGLSRHLLDDALVDNLPNSADALRVVNKLPGARTVGVSAIPHFRGGLRDETLVLFNNVELIEPVHLRDFHGPFSGIDPRAIDAIDVYTGGFPVRYGNRMSGVLDIAPAEPAADLAAALTISVLNAGAAALGRLADGRGDWTLSARRGNLDVVAERLERQIGTPYFHDAYGRFTWDFDPGTHVDAGLMLYEDDVEFIDAQNGVGEHAFSGYRNTYGWAQLRHGSSSVDTRTLISYATIRHGRTGSVTHGASEGDGGWVDDRRRFRILDLTHQTTFAREGWSAELGVGTRLATGRYDYLATGRRAALAELIGQPIDLQVDVRTRPEGWAGHAYGSVQVVPWHPFTIEAGLRLDRHDIAHRAYNQLSPRLAAKLELDASTVLSFAAGSFSQPQGIHELQVEDGVSRYQAPQRAQHFVAGLDQGYPSIGLQIHAEVYLKRFTKLKQRFENPMNPFVLLPELAPDRTRVDASAARARGVEITLRYRPSERMNAWLSYSRAEAEDRIDSRWRLRRWNQAHSFSGGVVWTGDPWTASATLLWHDGWRTTDLRAFVAEGATTKPAWNGERLPAFATLDVRISRTWRWRPHAVTVFAECSNLLNRANVGAVEYTVLDHPRQDDFTLVADPRSLFPVVPTVGLLWEYQ